MDKKYSHKLTAVSKYEQGEMTPGYYIYKHWIDSCYGQEDVHVNVVDEESTAQYYIFHYLIHVLDNYRRIWYDLKRSLIRSTTILPAHVADKI